jgi:hypothetical protein
MLLDDGGVAVRCSMLRGELTSMEDIYISFNATGAFVDEGWRAVEAASSRLTIPVGSVGIIRR